MTEAIYYNSWLTKYKKPFGAVPVNEEVTFTLTCECPVVEPVCLFVQKDFGDTFEVKMRSDGNHQYQVTIQLTEGQGLYYYYFKLALKKEDQTKIVYYGNNKRFKGGEGQVYENEHQVKSYQLTSYLYEDPSPKWYREGIAYHIFVDRFNNGNADGTVSNPKKNSFLYGSQEDLPMYIKNKDGEIVRWEFYGGNLKGIIQKLPYLNTLGITILYLSPIFEARSNHKYDTGDFMKIDLMFGDEEIFKELIQKSKELGMHILLDGVFNHSGADSRYFNLFETYEGKGAYQSRDSVYANWYTFKKFPDHFESWWGVKDLPKLDTQHPEVQSFIYEGKNSVIRKWSTLGIGGWRLDVADELSDKVLKGIRSVLDETAPNSVLIGEVWEDVSNKIAYNKRRHYSEGGMLHGAMNYPFREIILGLLKNKTTPKEAAEQWMNLKENYPTEVFKSNFNNIGTHDTKRILTELDRNTSKLKQAMALLFVLPGVPSLYYGDEVGVEGNEDPDNRRMYPWGRENKEIQLFVKKISAIRNKEASLKEGDFYPFSQGELMGIIRLISKEDFVVILFNTANKKTRLETSAIPEQYDFDVFSFLNENQLNHIQIEGDGIVILKKEPNQEITISTI
ncbi:glycoside hydrolase family 13 protein [Carnobacterium pleistocenium]|uniref:glycoside hydrolase family 13 protein n=1 Tax=Carnobacterium pleistocenium TaxID=181073 RepID=UPI000555CE2C|nr:glycoside hydrolase family 13 protein [Carnobacterium pleistocenium]